MSLKSRTLNLKVRLFCILSICCIPSLTFASLSEDYIQKAHELKLAQHHFWKDMLHFKGKSSQILDKDFFLSSRGRFDPQAELDATIEAYFTKTHHIKRDAGDKEIQCIFPARYMWLNQQLGLPGYKDAVDICPALRDWARFYDIESVSVLYVSGYLGNPASSFGHVLMNLKTANSDDLIGLSDTSISYGATVPLHENMILYALKGLLGGYYASFSDKMFYAHDQVYSNRESRDMWEYTLNFSDDERKMMIYHIAELLTKKYRYFFLNANCAHRMAVLLGIFISEGVYNHEYPIYVPEELFQRLHDIDQKRLLEGKQGLIKSIKYIPSARRHLYYETKDLTLAERNVFHQLINQPHDDFKLKLKDVDEGSRIHVLDALLAYQYYKLMASDEGKEDQHLKTYKDKILLERLQLPSEKEKPVKIPQVSSPKEVSPPSSFNLGYMLEDGNKPFTMLGATIFRKESVGLNALEYNDLVALDMNLGVREDESRVFLDRFDFIRIRDFKTFYIKEAKESPMSWRVRAGMDRYLIDRELSYDYLLDAGLGLVQQASDQGIYFGFINTGLHTREPYYRLGPSAGIVLGNKGPIKAEIDYGLDFSIGDFDCMAKTEAKLQYQINKKNAIQITFENSERKRLGVNYIYFW